MGRLGCCSCRGVARARQLGSGNVAFGAKLAGVLAEGRGLSARLRGGIGEHHRPGQRHRIRSAIETSTVTLRVAGGVFQAHRAALVNR